jgi:methyl-accepting chemotaxis protein
MAAELQECRSQLDAIRRSQAVIEFNMDGTVITANDNFLKAMGYRLEEIVDQHHRMFVGPEERMGDGYRQFWQTLNNGQFHEGRFRRFRKNGNEVWIQAMYYPVTDSSGKPVKIVKFASDITDQVMLQRKTEAAAVAVFESIDQMSHTISEIAGHANRSVMQAEKTSEAVEYTAQSVKKLDESSCEIEKVVELIRRLAAQTNLLALNATIESARAGEAGRGFAVVANEVKELAKQTAEATQHIDLSVSGIRQLICESVESTARVSESIRSVTECMTQVAAAVEEQSSTMRCLNETASGLRS